METTYSYSDSEAGKQTVKFKKLSELIEYIEDFEPKGESMGIVYENENPILIYNSDNKGLTWKSYTE